MLAEQRRAFPRFLTGFHCSKFRLRGIEGHYPEPDFPDGRDHFLAAARSEMIGKKTAVADNQAKGKRLRCSTCHNLFSPRGEASKRV
jgi:hypothetical protein